MAEIERWIKHYNFSAKEFGDEGYKFNVLMEQGKASACERILSFLDTLEVKEVKTFVEDYGNKSSWSEEDERIRQDIENLIHFALRDGSAVSPAADTTKEEALNWLKSLPDKVQLQPKQEWTEEDEKNLKKAVWYVENPAPNVVKDIMLSEWILSLKGRIKLA